MVRRTPKSTRTDTRFPDTALYRCTDGGEDIKREASVNRQGRRKAQSLRDLRLLFNLGDVFFFTRISVGSFGLDIALYIVLRGQAPDADNRGFLGFGIETCAVLSECPFERLINDAVLGCYLGGRFAGDLSPYLARFDDGYCKACILQQTGGRNTDDPPADYRHIDADVARELRKIGSGAFAFQ